MRKWVNFIAISFVLLLGTVSAAVSQEKRVALVVGVSAYKHANTLPNTLNDAKDIAAALSRLGFEVETVKDPDRAALEASVRRLGDRARGADVALFYYAGHALEYGGQNWLVPVQADLHTERDLRFETLEVDAVMDQIVGQARISLVMLDSCRDNPFRHALTGSFRDMPVGRGLAAPLTGASGTLVVYATAPGSVADDGGGPHSPFTAALLRHIEEPGVEIRELITRVRRDVRQATGGRQTPWDSSSLEGQFFLRPVSADGETVYWSSVQNSNDPAAIQSYLSRYPNGVFADLALSRIEQIRLVSSSASVKAKPVADPKAAAEAKKLADQQAAAEAGQILAEQKAAAEAKRLADHRAAVEAKRLANEQAEAAQSMQAKRFADHTAAAEATRLADEKATADAARRFAEQRADAAQQLAEPDVEAAQRFAEQRAAAEAALRTTDEREAARKQMARRLADQRAAAEAVRKPAEQTSLSAPSREQSAGAEFEDAAQRFADQRAAAEEARQFAIRRAAGEPSRQVAELAAQPGSSRTLGDPPGDSQRLAMIVPQPNPPAAPRLSAGTIFGTWCSGPVKMTLTASQWKFHYRNGTAASYPIDHYSIEADRVVIQSSIASQRVVTEFSGITPNGLIQLRGRNDASDWVTYNRAFSRCN